MIIILAQCGFATKEQFSLLHVTLNGEASPDARILDIDWNLNAKKTSAKPSSQFAVGDVVKGKISAVLPFGVFVELKGDIDGFLHSSEMINLVINTNDKIRVTIKEIDENRKFTS